MKGWLAVATSIVLLAMCRVSAGSSSPIDALPPGEWYEVPNSHLYDVRPTGWSANVMAPWSGGACDTTRDRLIVWGGGHGDYAGNEVYVFDLNTLAWSRLTDPSTDTGGDESSGVYPDGLPRSRHTYNYIQYVPNIDRFVTFGGSGLYPSGQIQTPKVHAFDFDTLTWEYLGDVPQGGAISGFSAYHPSTGHAWSHGNGYLQEYDPVANTWTTRSQYENDVKWAGDLTADIDPTRHKMVAVCGGQVFVWDLSQSGDISAVQVQTTGDTGIISGKPGIAYDPVMDKIVGWDGGADVYTLDLDTNEWTKILPSPSNTVVPTARASNGTFGRFRYCPSKDVFVVVNSKDENVFVYRLSAPVVWADDGDGIPDWWEIEHFGDASLYDETGDPDNDNFSNLQEYQAGSDPNEPDTDGDGISDGDDRDPTHAPAPFASGCGAVPSVAVALWLVLVIVRRRADLRSPI